MGYNGPIAFSVLIIVIIIVLLIIGIIFRTNYNKCISGENPFCLTIACPNDDPNTSPCKGYAYRPGTKDGYVFCSSAPKTEIKVQ